MSFHDVYPDNELLEGDLKGVRLGGEPVVLARVEGQVFAVGGVCTHAEALLEEGDIEGGAVICPLHGSRFDVRTGKAIGPPAHEGLPVFAVRIENGRILVGDPEDEKAPSEANR